MEFHLDVLYTSKEQEAKTFDNEKGHNSIKYYEVIASAHYQNETTHLWQ